MTSQQKKKKEIASRPLPLKQERMD